MRVPLNYIWRNLATRRLTTLLTAGGMAMVVYVFTTVLMLSEGLRDTLVSTGSDDNVLVIRKGAQTEIQSGVSRSQAGIVETGAYVAQDRNGNWLASKEAVVLISLPKRGSNKPSNVTIRGTSDTGFALRPQVKLVEGRMFRPGTSEIIAGRSVAQGFKGAGLGETVRFGQRDWTVVGLFDAGRTGFNSEIWGDGEQMLQAFRRTGYSAMLFKLRDSTDFEKAKQAIEKDPRLTLEAKRETQFYGDQSEGLATFINVLGMVLSVIFALGAIIGAMVTMYASVATRVGEIGTLRALGYRRRNILAAFLAESLLLGFVGGVMGLIAASFMQTVSISTMNFQTFAEVAFGFRLTPQIAVSALVFSLLMGLIGGFLPAARAARLKIVDALRAA